VATPMIRGVFAHLLVIFWCVDAQFVNILPVLH